MSLYDKFLFSGEKLSPRKPRIYYTTGKEGGNKITVTDKLYEDLKKKK